MKARAIRAPIAETLFAFDTRKFSPGAATRSSLGVALPLLIGAWQHQLAAGVLASIGALYTGLAAFGGVYRARIKLMIYSAVLTACATVVGILAGHSTPLAVAILFLAGVLAALYAARSPASSSLGLQSCAILVVLSSLGLPAETAFQNGLIVLLGSLGQLLFLGVVLPFNPAHPERTAVAEAIESLATYVAEVSRATAPETPTLQIPASQPFQDARAILDQASIHRWSAEHDLLLRLIQRAESIRAALVGWTSAFQTYRQLGPEQERAAQRVAQGLARSLMALQTLLRHGWIPAIKAPLAPIERTDPNDPEQTFRHWNRTVRRLIRFLATTTPPEPSSVPLRPAKPSGFFSALTRLPNVASLKKVSLLHAVRYATTLAVAAAIARWTGLGHAYWMPLTVALILRPDFATTFLRGLGRLGGTLVGVILATLILDLAHPSGYVLLVGMALAAWLCFAVFLAGYQAYTVAVTLFVVFSVSASGVTPAEIGITRLLATLGGVVLCMAAYIVWPALHWDQFWSVLRDAVEAQTEHGAAILSAPPREGLPAIDAARVKARGLRIQTETLLRSASLDPLVRGSDCLAAAAEAAQRLDENAAEMLSIEAAHFLGSSSAPIRMQETLKAVESLRATVEAELLRC